MTKVQLVELLAQQAKINKAAAAKAVKTMVQAIKDTVMQDARFTLTGFGTFYLARRKGRRGRNPRTGEALEIPPTQTLRFRPSAKLRKRG